MKWIVFCVVALCLLASTAYGASVSLAWDYTQGSIPAVSFKMWRAERTCTEPWIVLVTIPATTLTYTDTTAVVGSTYCYAANAYSASGLQSPDSNFVLYTVPAPGITAPGMLRIVP